MQIAAFIWKNTCRHLIVLWNCWVWKQKINLVGNVLASVVADEGEDWDAILMVEYTSAEAFVTVAKSDAYRDMAEQLRVTALANLKLYMTRPFVL